MLDMNELSSSRCEPILKREKPSVSQGNKDKEEEEEEEVMSTHV
jgi:hypothetical protein